MSKHRLLLIALLLIAAPVATWWGVATFSPELSIDLTQEQIQSQLDPRFPAEKCVMAAICIELREPKVKLDQGPDRLGLSAQFVATLGNRRMPGTTTFTGKPHYDQLSGSFYLHDVKVSEFQMSGNAPDFDEVIQVRGPKAMAAILERVPLYTLNGNSRQSELAKLALRSVQVMDSRLRITFLNPLGWFGRREAH